MNSRGRAVVSAMMILGLGVACGGKTPKPAPAARAEKPRPAAPVGPTRTDFKTIAKKLVKRCVAGGWINRWRSEAPDVDVAKPRIYLRDFEDRTGQGLDPTYLTSELARRMRVSGVYDMVGEGAALDFVGRGKLMKMAERVSGRRVSVYTATLDMLDPKSDRVAYSCEATVRGEM